MNPPGDIVALQQRASGLMQAGRVVEAIDAYGQLLARAPNLAESWFNLAWLQRQDRRFEDALRSYQRALAENVSGPEEVHANRAAILSADLGRTDEAVAELERALALKSDYLPALLNLGNLREDLGDRDGARKAYSRALEIAPNNALALARLGGISQPESAADPLIARIEGALSGSSRLPPADRSDLGFALGRMLDSCSEYDRAFEAYSRANEACAAAFGPSWRGYDPGAAERTVEVLAGSFALSEGGVGAPPTSRPAPVFVCGMFRSGSTLAEQLLGQHPRLVAGGELDILPTLVARLWPGFPVAASPTERSERLAAIRAAYLEELDLRFAKGLTVIDKRPDNFLFVGLIKAMFPDARIINTVRNPCDNILSIYFQPLGPQFAYATDLASTEHWYGQYCRLMAHWHGQFPDAIFDLPYDKLVAEPEAEVTRLLEFLDLPIDERCFSPEGATSAVRTASVWQVRQPLYRRSSGRWRNYEGRLGGLAARMNCA